MNRFPTSASLPVFVLSVALNGCAAAPPATSPADPPPATPAVARAGEDLVLPRAVPDLTSYVMIHANAGREAPREVTIAEAAGLLGDYDVTFFGEVHRHAGVHHAQMAVFREMYARTANLSLSMEQFERDQQPVLDEYLAGKIGENTMATRITLWSNYGTSYRPLVEFAKEHKLPVIAANAPGMVVRCVGLEGPEFLSRMKPEQRRWAAREINLQDGPYRDKFMGFATGDAGHGGDPNAKPGEKRTPSAQAVRAFAAQATRDDTMAESIADHLQKNPGRKVLHLTGHFHSDSFLGTVERLQLRMPHLKLAVINPIESGAEEKPKITAAKLKSGTLLLLVRPLPDPYATEEEMRAAIKQQMAERRDNKCEL
ncbi:MAG: ChaN family lipoprotein [Rhodospirillaceae bacterium]